MTKHKCVCMSLREVGKQVKVGADFPVTERVCPPGPAPALMEKVKLCVFADVGGINGSSSSVNTNRLWHLVRSPLLSGEVVHAKGLSAASSPRRQQGVGNKTAGRHMYVCMSALMYVCMNAWMYVYVYPWLQM